MHIAFLYTPGRLARLDDVRKGFAPSEFFYGAIEIERAGHVCTLHEIEPAGSARGAWAVLDRLFPRGMLPVKTTWATVAAVAPLLASLRRAEVVVATATPLAFAAAVWKRFGRLDRPLLGIQSGLPNYPHPFLRRALSRELLRQTHPVCFAVPEADAMRRMFGLETAEAISFGVDTQFWSPGHETGGGYVLSVGNDAQRDFETLVAAAGRFQAPVRILTERALPEPLPPNVERIRGTWGGQGIRDAGLRDLYRGARCVVVPLHPTLQPSGQSVTLQAMACGKPVVLTRTEGLWDRPRPAAEQGVLLVPPHDPAALADAVRSLLDSPAEAARLGADARRAVADQGDIGPFAARLLDLCLEVVG